MQIKITMLAAAILLAAGCSSSGKIEDYQRSDAIKTITIPKEMGAIDLPPLYPIPDVKIREEAFYDSSTDGFVVPRPEPMSAEREKAKIKIQKVGTRSWILVEAPTSQVWPLTQSFLMSMDMGATQSVASTGLVVTDWVVFNDDEKNRHQFKLRIEQGVRADTAEIHLLHRQFPKGAKANSQWPSESMEPARESWVLNELANSLAGNIGNKAASLLGQSVGGQVKAELFVDSQGEPALKLRLDQQRAWATVAHSLNKEGYVLWDEDSQRNLYYVQFMDFVPKRNWFTRMFLGESKEMRSPPYKLNEIVKHLDGGAKTRNLFAPLSEVAFDNPLPNGFGFIVVLTPENGDVVVRIRDYRGRLLTLTDNKKLLAVIRRNLI